MSRSYRFVLDKADLMAIDRALKDKETIERLKMVIRRRISQMRKMSKNLAPKRTYYLKNSHKIRCRGLYGAVYNDAEYSPYVEYGTRYMRAQEFLKRAFDRTVPLFEADCQAVLRHE